MAKATRFDEQRFGRALRRRGVKGHKLIFISTTDCLQRDGAIVRQVLSTELCHTFR